VEDIFVIGLMMRIFAAEHDYHHVGSDAFLSGG